MVLCRLRFGYSPFDRNALSLGNAVLTLEFVGDVLGRPEIWIEFSVRSLPEEAKRSANSQLTHDARGAR